MTEPTITVASLAAISLAANLFFFKRILRKVDTVYNLLCGDGRARGALTRLEDTERRLLDVEKEIWPHKERRHSERRRGYGPPTP